MIKRKKNQILIGYICGQTGIMYLHYPYISKYFLCKIVLFFIIKKRYFCKINFAIWAKVGKSAVNCINKLYMYIPKWNVTSMYKIKYEGPYKLRNCKNFILYIV